MWGRWRLPQLQGSGSLCMQALGISSLQISARVKAKGNQILSSRKSPSMEQPSPARDHKRRGLQLALANIMFCPPLVVSETLKGITNISPTTSYQL